MTISEKKIELVQGLLRVPDKATLFEIEKLIVRAFKNQKIERPGFPALETKLPASFDEWDTQFDDLEEPDISDEFGMTTTQFRQRIWAAEQSPELSLEEFFERVASR